MSTTNSTDSPPRSPFPMEQDSEEAGTSNVTLVLKTLQTSVRDLRSSAASLPLYAALNTLPRIMEPPAPPYEKPPPYTPNSTQPYPAPTAAGTSNAYYPYAYSNYPTYPQPQTYPPNISTTNPQTPLLAPTVYPPQKYGTNVNIQTSEIIFVGGCPICRVGVMETDYTCLGVLCAILCFPVGILCCLAMREKRCSNCGIQIG